jgi:hypothetical protein
MAGGICPTHRGGPAFSSGPSAMAVARRCDTWGARSRPRRPALQRGTGPTPHDLSDRAYADTARPRARPARAGAPWCATRGMEPRVVRYASLRCLSSIFALFLLTARHEDMEVVHLRAAFVCCIRHDSGSVSEKLVRLVRFVYPLPTEIHLSAKNTLLSPIEISRIYVGMVCLSWTLRP